MLRHSMFPRTINPSDVSTGGMSVLRLRMRFCEFRARHGKIVEGLDLAGIEDSLDTSKESRSFAACAESSIKSPK